MAGEFIELDGGPLVSPKNGHSKLLKPADNTAPNDKYEYV